MSNRALATETRPGEGGPAGTVDSACMRWSGGRLDAARESLVVEEPLAVEIAYERLGQPVRRLISVTMRTPGDDADLALGFLYCESLVDSAADVLSAESLPADSRGEAIPTLLSRLARAPSSQAAERVSRGILTSAACGLCGRTTLEGLRSADGQPQRRLAPVRAADVSALPGRLRSLQRIYPGTGGCHAAGLFGEDGEPRIVREDVGRHNAVDKVIGAALRAGTGLSGATLVLSGRAGFELIQKSA
ncbi:MAG TPA: formate dehydrogenase accessory sulfurtransferase FdhD, partial [Opitutaceae bacterium]